MNDFFVIAAIIACAILIASPATAGEASWQERMLFEPSPAQLALERERDRIMIYAGLQEVPVARALDRQFERIGHMIFVGTVLTGDQDEVRVDPETGSAQTEDDGC